MSKKRSPQAEAERPRPARRRSSVRDPPLASRDLTVVGIGASADGLDACTKLVGALRAETGMAFILVQHLDPTHASMMVELLATHTTLSVVQATDGMSLEPDHLYVIPPATYLSVEGHSLRVTSPRARRGARLPFDFLLHSLAAEYGARAVCVILSGTGAGGGRLRRHAAQRDPDGLRQPRPARRRYRRSTRAPPDAYRPTPPIR